MWSTLFPNRALRMTLKVLVAVGLVGVLFVFSATEVDFVYTGF